MEAASVSLEAPEKGKHEGWRINYMFEKESLGPDPEASRGQPWGQILLRDGDARHGSTAPRGKPKAQIVSGPIPTAGL